MACPYCYNSAKTQHVGIWALAAQRLATNKNKNGSSLLLLQPNTRHFVFWALAAYGDQFFRRSQRLCEAFDEKPPLTRFAT